MIITANISFTPVFAKPLKLGPVIGKIVAQFNDAELQTHAHATGINVQGDAKVVFKVLKDVIGELHQDGITRIITNVLIDSQSSAPASLQDKLDAVQAA